MSCRSLISTRPLFSLCLILLDHYFQVEQRLRFYYTASENISFGLLVSGWSPMTGGVILKPPGPPSSFEIYPKTSTSRGPFGCGIRRRSLQFICPVLFPFDESSQHPASAHKGSTATNTARLLARTARATRHAARRDGTAPSQRPINYQIVD